MEVILLYKNGVTEQATTNSCTNFRGTNIQDNLMGKSAKQRFNKDLKAYIFTVESYNKAIDEAQKHKLF